MGRGEKRASQVRWMIRYCAQGGEHLVWLCVENVWRRRMENERSAQCE